MRTKLIFLFLIVSVSLYSYILPYFQQQSIYFKETLKGKSYNSLKFKTEDKEYILNKSSLNDNDALVYVLANLFLFHKNSLNNFAGKHKIDRTKFHYELFNETPCVVYGTSKKNKTYDIDNLKPEIWLDNEKAYPVKVVFKRGNDLIIAQFNEYRNMKYKYLFPTKVTLNVNGNKKVYVLDLE